MVLGAVLISLAFTFGFGPRKADAGACNDLGLGNRCVEASDIAGSAVASGKVKNNSLRAVDLKDEPGADFVEGQQAIDLPAAYEDVTVRSVTITAPRPGVVIVDASGYLDFNAAAGIARCSITTGTRVESDHWIYAGGFSASNTRFIPFAVTRGFTVGSGSTIFNLVCEQATSGVSNIDVEDTSMTAIYVPTRY